MILRIRAGKVAAAHSALFRTVRSASSCAQRLSSMRRRRSVWSPAELDVLKYLLLIYGYRGLNYKRVARLFENRTPSEIKKRCNCIRDLERRKQKRARESRATTTGNDSGDGYDDDNDDAIRLLPSEGQLHPDVVWVPTTPWDIGHMNL